MTDKIYNVLFLCAGNSARSILAESILAKEGEGRFNAYSAGSQPKGEVNPHALKELAVLGYPTSGFTSKSWDVFAGPDAPRMDFIFTVCDSAAGEACPVWIGHPMPGVFQLIAAAEIAKVNIPVAILIWLMIIPMLLKIDFRSLSQVGMFWRGIGVTLFINWAVKPFSMALLGWFFIGWLFRPYLPAGEIDSYVAGLIILAAAPCTAMVFVWSNLTRGEPLFTLSQVALNDAIMVVAFAPLVGLLLGLSAITVPWDTLVLSVALYIVVPVILAQLIRHRLMTDGTSRMLDCVLAKLQPVSLAALLATLILLFAFQGEQIIAQPTIIGLLAIPILIQVYLNSGLAYLLNRMTGERHCVAGPSALIGASNFFELAVAAAISLFGFQSGAALATVVGVLIEVPVMLSVIIVRETAGAASYQPFELFTIQTTERQ